MLSDRYPYDVNARRLGQVFRILFILAIIQMIVGSIMVIFGIGCLSIGILELAYRYYCVDGSGIWTGILTMVSGVVCIVAVRTYKKRITCSQCSLVGHLVLAIFTALAASLAIAFAVIYIVFSASNLTYGVLLSTISACFVCCTFDCCRRRTSGAKTTTDTSKIVYQLPSPPQQQAYYG
uniref:Uncharacterized protein n=1 Tax=Romanomermis culicivorax TaxID=13658 RepID=A0A915HKJ6_ROMCU